MAERDFMQIKAYKLKAISSITLFLLFKFGLNPIKNGDFNVGVVLFSDIY